MKYKVIIHGKPKDQAFIYSKDLDKTFAEKIINYFFKNTETLREKKNCFLVDIVDNYSVYTYFVSNIKDTSSRPGAYIAISIVIKDNYHLGISYIYDYLKDGIYQKQIVGNYISSDGKYLKANFDQSILDAIETEIKEFPEFTATIPVAPNTSSKEYPCVSKDDANSLSSIKTLKSCRKLLVSESVTSYKDMSSDAATIKANYNNLKAKLDTANEEIKRLKEQIKPLPPGPNPNPNATINKLKADLEKEKELRKEAEKIPNDIYDDFQKLTSNYMKKLGEFRNRKPGPTPPPDPKPFDILVFIKKYYKLIIVIIAIATLIWFASTCMGAEKIDIYSRNNPIEVKYGSSLEIKDYSEFVSNGYTIILSDPNLIIDDKGCFEFKPSNGDIVTMELIGKSKTPLSSKTIVVKQ